MRIARFAHRGREGYGLVVGDSIAEGPALGLPESLDALLRDDPESWLDRARRALESSRPSLPLSEVTLRAPLSRPSKMVFLGLNYADHARETGARLPKEPVLFAKFPNSIAGPFDEILCPPFVRQLDYEAELGAVIGKRAKRVEPSRAMECVLGYTAVNDVSARDIQLGDGQWTRGKAMDTFCPMGPWLVTPDEVSDPHRLRITTRVNGEVRQDSSTAHMVFRIPDILSIISRGMVLEPGDIISTGTPAGVGMARRPPAFLNNGDVVEISIESIGTIRNRVKVE